MRPGKSIKHFRVLVVSVDEDAFQRWNEAEGCLPRDEIPPELTPGHIFSCCAEAAWCMGRIGMVVARALNRLPGWTDTAVINGIELRLLPPLKPSLRQKWEPPVL